MVQSGQNSLEVFVCMSSIVMKMLAISPYFLDHRITHFWFHRVGSPGEWAYSGEFS